MLELRLWMVRGEKERGDTYYFAVFFSFLKVISLQVHRHTHTCYKGGKRKQCRFNIPVFPMPETMLLEPLADDVSKEDLGVLRKRRNELQERLGEICKNNEFISMEEFLKEQNLTAKEYQKIVCSKLKRTTSFLKRDPTEAFINGEY